MKIIDSFFVALGFKADTKGLEAFQRKAAGARDAILSWRSALGGLFAGIGISKIAQIGSDFEQNRIQIAGFLNALGVSSDFNAGLTMADETIQSITNAAARLPGEAEEYIEVFKSGLPFVQGALPGASLGEMTDFTNKLTAIGKAMRLPADLIGREVSEMLAPGEGNAQKRLPLFRLFLPLMRQLQGQAGLTAQSFNAMTQPQRAKLMMQVFAKLQPMLDASAESFDALWGAVKSTFTIMTRLATAGLFKQIKVGLDKVENALFTADGKLTTFGQDLVGTAKKFIGWVTQLIASSIKFGVQLGKTKTALMALKIVLAAVALTLSGMIFEKVSLSVIGLITSLANLKRLLTGGLFLAFALITEDLWQFYNGGESVTGLLVEKFAPALDLIKGSLVVLGAALVATQVASLAAAAGLAASWAAAFTPIFLALVAIPLLIKMFDDLRKHSGFFNDRTRSVGQGMADAIQGIAKKFGVNEPRIVLGGDKVPDMGGEGVAATGAGPAAPWSASLPQTWTPAQPEGPPAPGSTSFSPSWGAPAHAGAGAGSVDASVHVNEIKIQSTDPHAAARETKGVLEDMHRRAIRNAQTGTAL
jgi:hypothetical protein